MSAPKNGALRRDYVHPSIPLRQAVERVVQKHTSMLKAARALEINAATLGSVLAGCPAQKTTVARLEHTLGLPPTVAAVVVMRIDPAKIGEADAGASEGA